MLKSKSAAVLPESFMTISASVSPFWQLTWKQFAEMIEYSPGEAKQRLCEVWKLTNEIGTDLRLLSRRLHSSVLDTLGLTAAIDAYCKEITKKHGIETDLSQTELPKSISSETSLCMFRILQEGPRDGGYTDRSNGSHKK